METCVRLFRRSTRSLLSIKFSDIGVSYIMPDEAIIAHAAAFYPGWEVMSVEQGTQCRILADFSKE